MPTKQTLTDAEYNRLMTESLASLKESKRVHEMFVGRLLDELQTRRREDKMWIRPPTEATIYQKVFYWFTGRLP